MSAYRNVVVAVDLSNESRIVVKRALEVLDRGAKVHLVYVQEPMDSVYMGVVPYGPVFVGMDEVEENLKKELGGRLATLGKEFGVAADDLHFLSGSPAREIHQFVDEHAVDLVVIGTHGQKGVQLLLGSTANSVLHGCSCDVLAVRIKDKEAA
jgi:universal stress protein A